jgi:hypothetical protein
LSIEGCSVPSSRPGIFLRTDQGELVHLRGELYESEDQLQALLEDNPELLLGETAESESPSKYLLIVREAGVPEAQGGSDRWFLDHLFLDGEGVPTLVEVKRSTDSRIRREVVRQMLDYAANILAYWPPGRMRDEFEARYEDPVREVREISKADYEAYWTHVKTNLEAKRLRLVFVADHIPASLQTIVEFLNEQMRAAEVLAVEVKQHRGDGLTVLTTQLIGRTSTAQPPVMGWVMLLRCEECGKERTGEEARGWRTFLTVVEEGEPAVRVDYCPDCAKREFDDDR